MNLLRIENLSLGYGGEPVLADLDLALGAGEFASLVGPSGSGKTSVLRAIVGLQQRQSGLIDLRTGPEEIGFLFQDDALLPWRTARENAALGLVIRGTPKAEALAQADAWLERLGLKGLGGRYPRQLSGGQRKRVAIAQVLVLRPRLLLMDEPFAALDAIVRTRITQDLLSLVERERISVLLVTHDLEEALSVSDVVHVLSNGPRARILASRRVPIPRPRDLLAARGHPAFAPLLRQLWRDLAGETEGAPARLEEAA
ncbi:ABC transporter ATP-binding protein [Crenalkalicoccus roseus]|uniref:ABC transporter ATP-binding protein n=1 Tax=Crenalkalicoccus roseus TaxID=1485588 RepID=UPI001957CFCC|nr:ABC transporter ATP-binding protein [Crenalkalicoccus roseus]